MLMQHAAEASNFLFRLEIAPILDPYERPVENVEDDETHGKHYPAAFVDPQRDLFRRHRREIVQFGKSWPA